MENSQGLIVEMFVIFCIFLIVYGFKLELWKSARTTQYVIIFSGGLVTTSLFTDMPCRLGIFAAGLFILFIRAVLYKKGEMRYPDEDRRAHDRRKHDRRREML